MSKVPVTSTAYTNRTGGNEPGSLCNDILAHITCYTGSINEEGAPAFRCTLRACVGHRPGRWPGSTPAPLFPGAHRPNDHIFDMPLKIAVESTVGAGPLFVKYVCLSGCAVYVRHGADITCVEVKGGTVDVRLGGRIVQYGDRVFGMVTNYGRIR